MLAVSFCFHDMRTTKRARMGAFSPCHMAGVTRVSGAMAMAHVAELAPQRGRHGGGGVAGRIRGRKQYEKEQACELHGEAKEYRPV
jgi:hypothetical protein